MENSFSTYICYAPDGLFWLNLYDTISHPKKTHGWFSSTSIDWLSSSTTVRMVAAVTQVGWCRATICPKGGRKKSARSNSREKSPPQTNTLAFTIMPQCRPLKARAPWDMNRNARPLSQQLCLQNNTLSIFSAIFGCPKTAPSEWKRARSSTCSVRRSRLRPRVCSPLRGAFLRARAREGNEN